MHVLVFNSPLHGHVTPTLGVVAELVARGNRVTYVTTQQFAGAVRAAGGDVLCYESSWPTTIAMGGQDGLAGLLALLTNSIDGVRAAQERFVDEPPDLILYDTTASAAGRALAHHWGVPAVETQPSFASNTTFSLTDTIRDKLAARTELPVPDESTMADFGATLSRFLGEFGIPVEQIQEFFARPENLHLVFVPREFQIAGDSFDGRYAFVGPCLANRTYQGGFEPAGDAPVVLVSFGTITYETAADLLATCLEAFANEPWEVVVATGAGIDPEQLGPVPAHVRVDRDVPQLAILRTASAFVSHAGMGGTMEALSLGVPVLAIPQMPEQEIVADRLVELGLGRAAAISVGSAALRDAVRELVDGDRDTAASDEMRHAIDESRGAHRAVDEIELYLLACGRAGV